MIPCRWSGDHAQASGRGTTSWDQTILREDVGERRGVSSSWTSRELVADTSGLRLDARLSSIYFRAAPESQTLTQIDRVKRIDRSKINPAVGNGRRGVDRIRSNTRSATGSAAPTATTARRRR